MGEPNARAEACLHPTHLCWRREAEPATRAGARCRGRLHVAGSRAEDRLVALGGRRCKGEQIHLVLLWKKMGTVKPSPDVRAPAGRKHVVVRQYRATLGAFPCGGRGDLPLWHPTSFKSSNGSSVTESRPAISQRFGFVYKPHGGLRFFHQMSTYLI